jgi:hypothetical protein
VTRYERFIFVTPGENRAHKSADEKGGGGGGFGGRKKLLLGTGLVMEGLGGGILQVRSFGLTRFAVWLDHSKVSGLTIAIADFYRHAFRSICSEEF